MTAATPPMTGGRRVCFKCTAPPAAGDELRCCSACRSVAYCGEACQSADWEVHKQVCAQMNAMRERAVATRVTTAAGKEEMAAAMEKFGAVPGLRMRVMRAAWENRWESPLMMVTLKASNKDAIANALSPPPPPSVKMQTRREWEKETPELVDPLKLFFDQPCFSPDEKYFMLLVLPPDETGSNALHIYKMPFDDNMDFAVAELKRRSMEMRRSLDKDRDRPMR
mmetsp:Transcript_5850/g.14856  ORF Transcript_5850/g.14856 Transcript_5850/m.14856 type:complete len:224 (+) Transcript_5850:481-1152(+)